MARWSDDATTGDLDVLAAYLARRDVEALDPSLRRFDLLLLCGSAVLESLALAADALHRDVVPRILVTGGVGHSTEYLAEAAAAHPAYADVVTAGRPEADVFAEILQRHHDVTDESLLLERRSTNCGENAERSLRLLVELEDTAGSLLLVQDPTMQRRTHASVEHHGHATGLDPEVVSLAPFVPVPVDGGWGSAAGTRPAWSAERFASLALGEVRRLRDDAHGYGPRGAGFIDHVNVPDDVLAAAARLSDVVGQAGTER